jgi:hypothetical protein
MSGTPSPDLRARILEAARRTPSPTTAERRRGTTIALAVAAAGSLALSMRLGVPADRDARALVAIALGGVALAVAAMAIAVTRGASMLGRPRGVLFAVVAAAPALLLVWASGVATVERGFEMTGGDTRQHLVCAAFTLLFAAGPFLALAYARRGTDPVHPRFLGAALGAASGAWGGGMIDLHCKVTAFEHLVLGHWLPAVALGALGALVGARVLGLRSEPVEHARERDRLPHVR